MDIHFSCEREKPEKNFLNKKKYLIIEKYNVIKNIFLFLFIKKTCIIELLF